jgi:hypothetical protein
MPRIDATRTSLRCVGHRPGHHILFGKTSTEADQIHYRVLVPYLRGYGTTHFYQARRFTRISAAADLAQEAGSQPYAVIPRAFKSVNSPLVVVANHGMM